MLTRRFYSSVKSHPVREFLYYFIISFLFYGCLRTPHEEDIEFFTRNDFKETEYLEADTVTFQEPLNPMSYLILKDTLILVTNLSHPEHFVEIYDLNRREIICAAVKTGRGPGEFLSCEVYYNNNENHFSVLDIVAKSWAKYNIDSLIFLKESYMPEKFKIPDFIKNVSELDSATFIGYNIWYLDNRKYFNNTEKLFIWGKNSEFYLNVDNTEKFYDVLNLTGAYIIVSPLKDKIVLPYYYDDKIEFYDNKGDILKVLKGPDNFKVEFSESNDKHIVVKDRKYYRAFYPFYYVKEGFYIIYLGANGLKSGENFRKPVEVFKISWEGELLRRYQLDNYIFNISLDSKQENIYGTHIKKYGDAPVLLKYRLKNW